MKTWPKPDPLEWRGDRRLLFDLWRILNRDVDRASVALATYQRQEPTPTAPRGQPDGNVDPD